MEHIVKTLCVGDTFTNTVNKTLTVISINTRTRKAELGHGNYINSYLYDLDGVISAINNGIYKNYKSTNNNQNDEQIKKEGYRYTKTGEDSRNVFKEGKGSSRVYEYPVDRCEDLRTSHKEAVVAEKSTGRFQGSTGLSLAIGKVRLKESKVGDKSSIERDPSRVKCPAIKW